MYEGVADFNDTPLFRLLGLLSDGEFHSGQELGVNLGVSRAAIWKQLKKIDGLGLELNTKAGLGYQLVGGLDLLDESKLQKSLTVKGRLMLASLALHRVVGSTNKVLMDAASALPAGAVCLAEQQLAGRGRRGRIWVSPFARNIYLSVLWHFEQGAAELEGLSLACGVAVYRVLSSLGVSGVKLKWPNDVLVNGKKLAGVLLEMGGEPSGNCYVVVGVGVNVLMPKQSAMVIDQPWVDIDTLVREQGLPPVKRNQLAAALMSELLVLLSTYSGVGFKAWRDEWMEHGAFLGEKVSLTVSSGRVQTGVMLGVSDAGALQLGDNGATRLFYGGEVSMRPVS